MSRTVPQWVKDSKYHFCAACGREDDLQYHHLVPTVLGGKTEPSNIIVLCGVCHQKWHMQSGSEKHNYLVKEGIAKAKEKGVKVGRKPADGERIMRAIAERSTQFNEDSTTTEGEIMEHLGIRAVCYNKYKRMLITAMSGDEWPYEWGKPVQVRAHPVYAHKLKRMREEVV